jgi:RNA polymerase sigma factor (sigma-70 family)
MSATMPSEPHAPANLLGDPSLRRTLEDFVRRRVPAADVDDVVQTVLVDALAAEGRPDDARELTKWLLGVARHKVADLHRRAHREPPAELPEIEASPAPIEARELARWAEEQAGSTRDAKQTLAWMAREGEGEKLETIATEAQVPAARVRQRVSRMRRWMKERWLAELAAVAALGMVALVAWWILRRMGEPERPIANPVPSAAPITPEPPDALARARSLRADALERCRRSEWAGCLDELDQARAIDPAGDADPAVGAARSQAAEALKPPPSPTAVPSPSSTSRIDGIKSSDDGGLDLKSIPSDSDGTGKKAAPVKPAPPTPTAVTPTGTGTPGPVKPSPKPAFPKKSGGGTGKSGTFDFKK